MSRPARRATGTPGVLLTTLVAPLLALVALVGGAPTASAHAYLASSDPVDGAVLPVAPTRLTLTFSEHVEAAATSVTLVAADGTRRPLGTPQVEASQDREEPSSVTVTVPDLGRGAYQVAWSTLSSDDLHATSGTFGFGVGAPAPAVGWTETAPDLPEAALRALVLLGLLLGAAHPAAAGVLRRRGLGDATATAVLARVGGGAALLGAVGGLALLAAELSAHPSAAVEVLRSRYGAWWAVREVALVAVALLLAGPRRPGRDPRRRERAAALAVLPAALATALLGHSGSGETGSPARTALSTLHVLSTSVWVGTLGLLVVVLVVRRPGPAAVRSVLVGFGPVAVAGVAGTAVTGVALAAGVVGSLDALVLTDYGRLLLAKVVLVGALLVAGAVTHRRLRRRVRGRRPVLRLVVAEAAGGLVVLLLTALVTSGQPATERQLVADPAAPGTQLRTAQVGGLQEELTLRPNLPGSNVAVLRVADPRRPSPGPVASVSVGLVDAAGRVTLVPATPLGDGRWSAPVQVGGWGPTSVRTVVTRRGVPGATQGDLDWTVTAPAGTAGVLLSRAPLRAPLQSAAWVLVALVAVGLVLALRRAARPVARGGRTRAPEATRPSTAADAPPGVPVVPGGRGH